VQTLLQQMQDKFQTMSDQIIGRNILPHMHDYISTAKEPSEDLLLQYQHF
ncbi:hypothetical protein cypCar_00033466, partial [Cyprinus carpio]